VVFTKLAESSWRTLLFWLGPPGLAVAGLCLLTLDEPRKASTNILGSLLAQLKRSKPAPVAVEEPAQKQLVRVRQPGNNPILSDR
jgi:hypothetical protein